MPQKPGDKFNRLTMIKRVQNRNKHIYNQYVCDCGNTKVIMGHRVKTGRTKSCGCLLKEHLEHVKEEKYRTKAGAKGALYGLYKVKARKRGYEFALKRDEFISITQNDCHYCGGGLSNLQKTAHDKEGFYYNGVDRVDNEKGYIVGNCVPCCKVCNMAKGEQTVEEFYAWIARVTNHKGDLE